MIDSDDESDQARFIYSEYDVRVFGTPEDPWFLAKDVCDALGISTANLARDLDEDEQGVTQLMTPGGVQDAKTISESGLYSLILRSRKDSAKKFKKWVTSEVLPALRKQDQGKQARDPRERKAITAGVQGLQVVNF